MHRASSCLVHCLKQMNKKPKRKRRHSLLIVYSWRQLVRTNRLVYSCPRRESLITSSSRHGTVWKPAFFFSLVAMTVILFHRVTSQEYREWHRISQFILRQALLSRGLSLSELCLFWLTTRHYWKRVSCFQFGSDMEDRYTKSRFLLTRWNISVHLDVM